MRDGFSVDLPHFPCYIIKNRIGGEDMNKRIFIMLLLLVCMGIFLTGCYEYSPPPTGAVGPAPGYYEPPPPPDPSYDPGPPPSGAVGPAPRHREYDRSYESEPPPSGAVGPARYR